MKIMGIVNMTPDSFSDGSDYNTEELAYSRILKMKEHGADIIDIGGESTRPGYEMISDEEEISRILPIIKRAKGLLPISVDSYKPKVLLKALENGANIINDIWGFQYDEEVAKISKTFDCDTVIMHNSKDGIYKNNIMDELKTFFYKSIDIAVKNGVNKDRLILDPGIGFKKTQPESLEILKRIKELKSFGLRVLLGVSRKRIIDYYLNLDVNNRDNATLALSVYAMLNGVDIVRVHNVKMNVEAKNMIGILLNG